MKISTKNRSQLANNLQSLPAEQIKKAVIKLLSTENIEFIDWEHSLSLEIVNFQQWVNNQRRTKSSFLDREAVIQKSNHEKSISLFD